MTSKTRRELAKKLMGAFTEREKEGGVHPPNGESEIYGTDDPNFSSKDVISCVIVRQDLDNKTITVAIDDDSLHHSTIVMEIPFKAKVHLEPGDIINLSRHTINNGQIITLKERGSGEPVDHWIRD